MGLDTPFYLAGHRYAPLAPSSAHQSCPILIRSQADQSFVSCALSCCSAWVPWLHLIMPSPMPNTSDTCSCYRLQGCLGPLRVGPSLHASSSPFGASLGGAYPAAGSRHPSIVVLHRWTVPGAVKCFGVLTLVGHAHLSIQGLDQRHHAHVDRALHGPSWCAIHCMGRPEAHFLDADGKLLPHAVSCFIPSCQQRGLGML